MGLRFRKSVKIAPGVKLNFNKKSTGVTFGGKGVHYSVNSDGKRTKSVGIPGTGISYSSSNKKSKSSSKNNGGCTKFVLIGLLILFILGGFFSCIDGEDDVVSETSIRNFEFHDTDSLELEVGEKDRSYFEVECNDEFAIEDIKFVSSNEKVVTFTYDKTLLTTHVYYNVNAVGQGTATIYVQTADGIVKSEEITVTVTGEEATSKAPETTKQDETTTQTTTTTNAPETTTAEKTTVAETTTERQTTTERETTTEKPAGRTVYITPKGKRYHLDPDCGGKNSYSVSINNVGGRTACQKCAQ